MSKDIEILPPFFQKVELPYVAELVSAGFPSPAEDYIEKYLDINEYMIKNKEASFYVRVKGDSMIDAHIFEDDILLVDRSIAPTSGKIVIAVIDGEFTVKRLIKDNEKLFLVPENPSYEVIELNEEMDFKVWGVVSFVIHKV